MNEVTYATVRCTYTELRTADGVLLYSLSGRDCAGVVPFAIENYTESDTDIDTLRCAIARYRSGKMSAADLPAHVGNWSYVDGALTPSWRNSETDNIITEDGIMSGAFVKVYLTQGGYDTIKKLSGAAKAYQLSGKDLYVFVPSIKPVENVTVEVDPEPVDPYQPKKKETSVITKILLALAGWALFN